jgi:microcystin degradation protein MlrC
MAILATVETTYGEVRELYVRLNNIEASNHGVAAVALFRGYISSDAFESGKGFVWERSVEFAPDVSKPLWEQAYAAVKADVPGAMDA